MFVRGSSQYTYTHRAQSGMQDMCRGMFAENVWRAEGHHVIPQSRNAYPGQLVMKGLKSRLSTNEHSVDTS